ncbi:hypothetical protein R1flu_006183 [Riccia fluitans]|uniref:Uncharacterized protein n=1 Tax=Riccia fluitans TaxID=41844 RepID=A0ABD1YY37_9MARC
MRSIFDSYVNPTNDPNVQPLVKGLNADNFSVDKFFGLQDPTSPDDVQAGLDFEEDLTTNERLRLRAESRNLTAELQRLTRSTRVFLKYEPTILSDVPPTDNLAFPVTLDLTVDAHKDPSSPPPSQIVSVPGFMDLTQYASSLKNEGSEDQGWPLIFSVNVCLATIRSRRNCEAETATKTGAAAGTRGATRSGERGGMISVERTSIVERGERTDKEGDGKQRAVRANIMKEPHTNDETTTAKRSNHEGMMERCAASETPQNCINT